MDRWVRAFRIPAPDGFAPESRREREIVTNDPVDDPAGKASDAGALLRELHAELHRLAAARMAKERVGHTLSATALLHEAWLRISQDRPDGWASRAQFFASAAEAMRRVLVDHARAKGRQRRGGGVQRVGWTDLELPSQDDPDRMLDLDEAVQQLERLDDRVATLVRLRLFAGLGEIEVAEVMGASVRTVRRDWQFARAWLFQRLGSDAS